MAHDRMRRDQLGEGPGRLLLPPPLVRPLRIWWTLCSLGTGQQGSQEEGRESAGSTGCGSVFTEVEHLSKRSVSAGASFTQPFPCGPRWPTASVALSGRVSVRPRVAGVRSPSPMP